MQGFSFLSLRFFLCLTALPGLLSFQRQQRQHLHQQQQQSTINIGVIVKGTRTRNMFFTGMNFCSFNRISICRKMSTKSTATKAAIMVGVDPILLAKMWTTRIFELELQSQSQSMSQIRQATERTLPLFLEDESSSSSSSSSLSSSVPFVCRYRSYIINPLTTKQVHFLQSLVSKHSSLKSLRHKLLTLLSSQQQQQSSSSSSSTTLLSWSELIKTSTSRTELEDIYAPFRPPSQNSSVINQIRKDYPQLIDMVDNQLWNSSSNNNYVDNTLFQKYIRSSSMRECFVYLLSTKLANEPMIVMAVVAELRKYCRIQTTMKTTITTINNKDNKLNNRSNHYNGFVGNLFHLKDHQVLAIRRALNQKVLKIKYDIPNEEKLWMERFIENKWRNISCKGRGGGGGVNGVGRVGGGWLFQPQNNQNNDVNLIKLRKDVVKDVWKRLLRKRCTNRIWKKKCDEAQRRAIVVFGENLYRALLAPPLLVPRRTSISTTVPLLALDPGYRAGIKCAIIGKNGSVIKLDTVFFLNEKKVEKVDEGGNVMMARDDCVNDLCELLVKTSTQPKRTIIHEEIVETGVNGDKEKMKKRNTDVIVPVALGNGHGSQNCRMLIQEASNRCGIPINIHLVNEAGASVWSVSEQASEEFPNESPSSISSISIGRRLQNPLHELIKIPPHSLGLGMYQHDLSEKELDETLHRTSVDAVAMVGVDINICGLEILRKVPGLDRKGLAERIITSRPFLKRLDLLDVKGLGPKTYENCIGFCRVSPYSASTVSDSDEGDWEPLDATMVHPESYELARWLLKQLSWKLNNNNNLNNGNNDNNGGKTSHMTVTVGTEKQQHIILKGSVKFSVDRDHVSTVLKNLVDSIANVDPRLKEEPSKSLDDLLSSSSSSPLAASNIDQCVLLPPELAEIPKLASAIPVRGIIGTIRNIADFGAFVDFGGCNDGLLHTSKLRPSLQLSSLLIGQQLGVDILGVTVDGKISLGMSELNLNADDGAVIK